MAAEDALELDATGQLNLLATRRISAVELLKASLARHEQTHTALNAVVSADLQRAMERARAIDDLRLRGESLGPLAGLPMTIKDSIDVAGMPASSGLARFKRRTASDATVVGHLRQAGAVIWGKTKTPVMAGDWQTFNDLYGVTNNPWDVSRTCGGSSGGSAVAVASLVSAADIGSDIGGSLRVPASFCGVFAHKATWGMITQRGSVPPQPGSLVERDLNVLGPLARSARDLRLLLSILENGPLAAKAPPAELTSVRIGLWLDAPNFPLDPQARAVIEAFAGELTAAGVTVEPIAAPVDPAALLDTYVTLLGSIIGEDLPDAQMRQFELMRGPAGAFKSTDDPFAKANLIRAYTATHREWMAADAVRMRLRQQMGAFLGGYDVVMTPAAPLPAFPHDHRAMTSRKLSLSDGSKHPYLSMLCWSALATTCRLPATAIPAGLTTEGLPVGVQLIGPHAGDGRLLSIAQAIDENVRGFVGPPNFGL